MENKSYKERELVEEMIKLKQEEEKAVIEEPIEALAERVLTAVKTVEQQKALAKEFNVVYRQLKKKEKELEKTNEELKTSNQRIKLLEEMKNEFVSIISYELKAPINIIEGYLNIILEGMTEEVSPRVNRVLSAMLTSVINLRTLLNELTLFCKLEQRFDKLEKNNYPTADFFKHALDKFADKVKEKKLKIEQSVENGLEVFADFDRFSQAVNYIIDSVVKFIKEEGTIRLWAQSKDDNLVELKIIAKGTSISEEGLSKVFDPFCKIDGCDDCLGLGLSIAKHIIEEHWGEIHVESEKGKGTVFTVLVPTKRLINRFKSENKLPAELKDVIDKVYNYDELYHKWQEQEIVLRELDEKAKMSSVELRKLYAKEKQTSQELKRVLEVLQKNYVQTVKTFSEAIDSRSPFTHDHSKQVALYARLIAKEMQLPPWDVELTYVAGLFHDIGNIAISEEILLKPSRLTEDEYDEIKKHPLIGAELIQWFDFMKELVPAIKHHQEKYDGTGYPSGLKGEEIPLISRILAISDAFDAMVSGRPYRTSKSYEEAVKELTENKGTQFDPVIVDTFIKILKEKEKAAVGEDGREIYS